MQMLGTQVLFGFQLQALFQPRFTELSHAARLIDAGGLGLILIVMALLLAVPSQHRLVEQGQSSIRLFKLSLRYANVALVPMAGAIAADIYIAVLMVFGSPMSTILSVGILLAATAVWFGLALSIHPTAAQEQPVTTPTPLHAKIEQMLTEARVVLPGAQALLGFQLIVTMTKPFAELSRGVQIVHVVALMSLACAIILLIAPAAIQRISFEGMDDPRVHSMGSTLITVALAPMAIGLTCDVWVALTRLVDSMPARVLGTFLVGSSLIAFWYAVPLLLRRRLNAR